MASRKLDFDKETFKKEVVNNVKALYRRTIDEANDQQVFQAVCYAIKDTIIDQWIATHKEYEKRNAKTVYYLSMEFLMGRALGNNLINLTYYDEVKETGIDNLQKEIRRLKRLIARLKKEIEDPRSEPETVCPSKSTVIYWSREYLAMAKKALAESFIPDPQVC